MGFFHPTGDCDFVKCHEPDIMCIVETKLNKGIEIRLEDYF